jgi:hypothetical protein
VLEPGLTTVTFDNDKPAGCTAGHEVPEVIARS